MVDLEKLALTSVKGVVMKFFGCKKNPSFKNITENTLKNFQELDCSMRLKLRFLNSHVDYFLENLSAVT